MTEEQSQQAAEIGELKRETKYGMIGFELVNSKLLHVHSSEFGIDVTSKVAMTVMNDLLAQHFLDHEDQYLDPEIRKYIILGATAAYTYWQHRQEKEGRDQGDE